MALLPPAFLDAVVAIGTGDKVEDRDWIGTGFFFGKVINDTLPVDQREYRIWLVTNRHVLENLRTVYIKSNSAQGTGSKDYQVQLVSRNGKNRWIGHPDEDIDVAVIPTSGNILKTEGRSFFFFQSDIHVMLHQEIKQAQVTEGDGIFLLGFPLGLVHEDRQYVICRNGCIARIRDFSENRSSNFLIDASVFPGNSGGPVILSPYGMAVQGTNPNLNADLIGIVRSYLPYQDIAISEQTKKPRIIFEENTGLAVVESVDSIMATIQHAEKKLKERASAAKSRQRKRFKSLMSPD